MLNRIPSSLSFPLSSPPNLKTAAGTLAVGLSLPLTVLAESGQDALGSAGELLATYLAPAALFTGIVITAATIFLCCRKPTTASDENVSDPQALDVVWSVKNGDVDAVRRALDGDVDVNQADEEGLTLLHYACMFGRGPVVSLLIERGADRYTRSIGATGDTTPFIAACTGLNYEVADLLLDIGTEVSADDKRRVISSLTGSLKLYADNSKETEVISRLISKLEA